MAISGRREDAVRMLAFGVSMLEQAMLIDADKDRVADMAKLLHDTVSNICGRMHREMDEQGLAWEYQPIDMTDLDIVLARLPRTKP
jgi:hypothetical protein